MDDRDQDPFSLRQDLLRIAKKIANGNYAVSLALMTNSMRKQEILDCFEVLKFLDESVDAYWTAHRKAIYRKQNEETWRWN